MKKKLNNLKKKILENIESKISVTIQYTTIVGRGLIFLIRFPSKITKLKNLVAILWTDKVYVVKRYSNKKEDSVEPDLWNNYTVDIGFYELSNEIPSFNKLYFV